ncbi:MAG: phospho-N-acetylmuramoyl-pentapeptide-transferase [Ruminococcus sp.]|nr:phospho-N-acetylmuramoyl-pentapeptide-transferase [Ruminococcus sp.]
MIYKWLCTYVINDMNGIGEVTDKLPARWSLFLALMLAFSFGASYLALRYLKAILPKDQGREFAVNGELSQGKARGCGLLFITTFTFAAALFVPLTVEYIVYLVCIYGAMLTGYFDDAAKVPWGNLKKGLFDLAISVGVAVDYWYFNGSDVKVPLFGLKFHIPAVIFIVLAGVLVWTSINVTNCSDGVDGLCCTQVMVVLVSLVITSGVLSGNMSSSFFSLIPLVMLATLAAYLWFNCSPSSMLMGDAGSRALGVLLAVLFLLSRAPFSFIPLCLVLILDGGLSLLKVSFIRFLHMKDFMKNIRTPIHDHERKNKGWSDTQVVLRFVIIQAVISLCYIGAANWALIY